MFAAQPWDWWIALVLFGLGVVGVLAVVFGYLIKVVGPQYPRRGQTIVEPQQRQKTS